jgi:hypothetical protein
VSDSSAKKLERSQQALAMMFEQNQDALVSRIDAMLKPIEDKLLTLQTMVDAMGRQIDQLHLRQEAQERVNEWIVGNQEEKRVILHDINAQLTRERNA